MSAHTRPLTGCAASNNSQEAISKSPPLMSTLPSTQNTTMGVNSFVTMVQPPTAGHITNSLQQFIQFGGINHNSAPSTDSSHGVPVTNPELIFNSSTGVVQFPGIGPPIVQPKQTGMEPHSMPPSMMTHTYEKRTSNPSFAQLLPKLHPMSAVPICVSALSHGPPHMAHQQKLGNAHGVGNMGINNTCVSTSFSPQTNSKAQQQHLQHQHQLQVVDNMNQIMTSPPLSHPGQYMRPQQQPLIPQQHTVSQQMATVPKQNLSHEKSIISIGTENIGSSELTNSSTRMAPQYKEKQVRNRSHNMAAAIQPTPNNTNIIQFLPSPSAHQYVTGIGPATSMITKKQMEERQQSSYSSACNATIKAQQKLSSEQRQQGKCVKMEEDENDTRDQVNGSLVSVSKAAATISCVRKSMNYAPICKNNHIGTGTKRNLDGVARNVNNDKIGEGLVEIFDTKIFEPTHKYVQVVGGKVDAQQVSKSPVSPHAYLQKLLVSRGYSTKHYCSLEGGYYCRPTPLQCASYGLSVVQAVRTSNVQHFAALLSAGLSRNPCNKFGESILHMVCRRGDYELLKLLLDNGSTIQVSDDFGRTPLHDACWTAKPCFKSIEMLLGKDLRLLHIVDCRGSPPLEYVKKESWGSWIEFFEKNKEIYWPQRDVNEGCEECPPELVNVPPHSRPVIDPKNCATLEAAAMYANGKKQVL